ncbi:Odorant receptor 2a [Harpegnathos saltator]|uniref:Odorant receptor 2a n=1 Tax=Harpegnathos saltator TaxID=610380 RepID=E2C9T5_HARSA|nr:Odorant receptor 2a [Harpegnathos saltator]
MEEDWKDCANNDIEMRKVISKAKISRYVSNAIITLHTVAVLFYGISIILTNVDITDRTIEIPHIMRMEFPFNIKTQSTYKFVLIMELIQLIMSSWGMGMINALLITLALDNPNATEKIMRSLSYYSVTNLEAFIFCYAGEYLINKSKVIGYAAYDSAWYDMEPKDRRILLLIILRSQKQLTLTIGKLMDLSLQRFTSALGSPNATEKIIRSLPYYSVTNLEAFIFCYAGEYLINKSKEIGYAAYDSAWYNMEPKYRHILLFIILRSQKYLTLTIGKLMDLSLRRFTSIMNSAGSFISVLLAMQ